MAFNGSGTFSRIYSWVTDRNDGLTIQASRMDEDTDDIADGLTNCLCKDGQSTPTANIPMGGFKLTNVGDATNATDAMNRQASDARYPLKVGTTTDNAVARYDSTAGQLQNSGIIIDDSNNVTGYATVTLPNTGLHLLDTNASHDLIIAPGSNLTADRTLTVTTGDADRTVTLTGNLTMSGAFNLTHTITADTNVTYPTTGTLATLAGSETLTNKTLSAPTISGDATASGTITYTNTGLHILDTNASHDLVLAVGSNLTADRTLTITTGDADRTLNLSGGTFHVAGNQIVLTATASTNVTLPPSGTLASLDGTETLTNKTLTDPTVTAGSFSGDTTHSGTITLANTGLHLLDSNATHDLIIAPGSNLTADRTLTVTTGDANRTLDLGADLTYAEGTFTPTVTLVGGAGNTVPVYSTNTGRYTRLGRKVFVEIVLSGDGGAEGAGTGVISVALPIQSSASNTMGPVPVGRSLNSTTMFFLLGAISPSTSTIALSLATSPVTNFTGADQNNTTRDIRLNFNYEV